MAALSLVADGAMGALAPCHNRLNGDLPEPRPGPVHANQSSHPEETYPLLKTPGAAVGLTSSVVTLLLVWAARARRVEDRPPLRWPLRRRRPATPLGALS